MPKLEVQLPHLKKDKVLKKIILSVGEIKTKKNLDLYFGLMRSIVSQQLSIKAAATIWGRFLDSFNEGYPDPEILLKMKDDQLRAVGLSYQKAGYLKNIARFSIERTLDYKLLKLKTDDELIEYLVEIKGVGRWTVEMLLMFSLNRYDVFPIDDLGIQNGIKSLYKLNPENKKQLHSQMIEIANSWKPYRSLACMYVWRYKDTKV
jgi:DNA-3-methyladenine glycosylase II